MVFAQPALTLLILLICSFSPGFFFVRRLRWSVMEKLCASAGLSFILVWLAAWALFLAGWNGAAGCFGITLICAAMGAIAWRDLSALLRAVRVRQAVLGFAFLLAWTLLVLSMIRHYSGAGWAGDWLEQFSRSLFFLHHFPMDSEMYGGYRITSRPPGLNVIAAFTMAQAGDGFDIFQLTYTFLNLLLFLPCCLMLPVLGRARRRTIFVLTAIFACSPLIIVNATYTGAKSFAAFYIILGTAFYLAGWRKQDRVRITFGFLAFAAALLAHYSAVPYCAFFALHYLIAVFPKRREKWQELGGIAAAAGALLLAWFGWTVATFGISGTVLAPVNTSIAYGPKGDYGYVAKVLANLFDTTVPHVLRSPYLMHTYDQPSVAGYVRDNAFAVYQTGLIFSMGIFGGPLVAWFVIGRLRDPATPRRNFWVAMLAFVIVGGLMVVGERDYFGVGHLTLISLLALGLTFLATRFRSSRAVALAIVAGCAIDFGLGVFLQARVEHLENTPQHVVFGGLTLSDAGIDMAMSTPDSLYSAAWLNWFRKHEIGLSEKWLHDLAAFRPNDASLDPVKAAIRPTLEKAIAEEQRVWHGWYHRHGGEMTFFGDHFGDSDITSVLLLLLAAGLLWRLARLAPVPGEPARVASKRAATASGSNSRARPSRKRK